MAELVLPNVTTYKSVAQKYATFLMTFPPGVTAFFEAVPIGQDGNLIRSGDLVLWLVIVCFSYYTAPILFLGPFIATHEDSKIL